MSELWVAVSQGDDKLWSWKVKNREGVTVYKGKKKRKSPAAAARAARRRIERVGQA